MADRKKKILIHSNFSKAFTGFGKHKKNLLKYLYKTGKYELVELVNAKNKESEELKNTPWKSIGTLPTDHQILKKIQKDQVRMRNAGYGHEMIDELAIRAKATLLPENLPELEWAESTMVWNHYAQDRPDAVIHCEVTRSGIHAGQD